MFREQSKGWRSSLDWGAVSGFFACFTNACSYDYQLCTFHVLTEYRYSLSLNTIMSMCYNQWQHSIHIIYKLVTLRHTWTLCTNVRHVLRTVALANNGWNILRLEVSIELHWFFDTDHDPHNFHLVTGTHSVYMTENQGCLSFHYIGKQTLELKDMKISVDPTCKISLIF